ncbi:MULTISPECIES: hypothetical protein [unclassified Pseudonocardia]|uniref:hypothetical protein n=1 Tax=unclassified Pseudonocardia TaxID=2619320 RepID=UPI0001FFDB4D|nr:hypothetical protein [Pseudonocardia sp. Ae707_Ps1]
MAAVLVVAGLACLTSCGGATTDLAGQWAGTCSPSPQDSILRFPTSLELDDSNVSMTVQYANPETEDVAAQGTYETVGDTMTLDIGQSEPVTARYTIDEDQLVLSTLKLELTTPYWCTLIRG